MPKHTGGNKEEPTNYRSESLTSVLAKLCETITKDRWVPSFCSIAKSVLQEREVWLDCIYLDLKKPFHKVPYNEKKCKVVELEKGKETKLEL